ncbi:hypothetical protein F5Y05DRAFT_409503 [Hypoxylon sp. FL0543]|nr:hypothetical protein F5Y05DRAFT_409503 [Hypoxylon sp. FL0543]
MAGGKAWTMEEKISFLVQIIEHLPSKAGMPYKQVELPGRTERSMGHTWNHLRAESHAFLEGHGGNKRAASESTPTPGPRRSTRKRKHEGSYRDSLSEDDEDKIPVKKARLMSDEKTLTASQDGDDSDLTTTDASINVKAHRRSQGAKKSEDNIKAEFDEDEA